MPQPAPSLSSRSAMRGILLATWLLVTCFGASACSGDGESGPGSTGAWSTHRLLVNSLETLFEQPGELATWFEGRAVEEGERAAFGVLIEDIFEDVLDDLDYFGADLGEGEDAGAATMLSELGDLSVALETVYAVCVHGEPMASSAWARRPEGPQALAPDHAASVLEWAAVYLGDEASG